MKEGAVKGCSEKGVLWKGVLWRGFHEKGCHCKITMNLEATGLANVYSPL